MRADQRAATEPKFWVTCSPAVRVLQAWEVLLFYFLWKGGCGRNFNNIKHSWSSTSSGLGDWDSGLSAERSGQGKKGDPGCFSFFFNDIFCLLSRGSDSSQEKQTPTRTQHDILFFLQRRLTINFIPSPDRIAYFLFLSSHLLSSLSASSLTYPRDPGVIFRGSERTSGLFAGRISGSRHQISRFLGYIKRAAPFPAMQLHKRIRPERYYPGKDVSWEFKAKWKWTWVCRRWLSSIISIEEILF